MTDQECTTRASLKIIIVQRQESGRIGWFRGTEMSLEPKQVDFNEVWQNLRETAKEVITLQAVKRAVWNNKSNDV